MKNSCNTVFIALFFVNMIIAQEIDSMKYYVKCFSNNALSAEERRTFGLKIRALQKSRYLKLKNKSDVDTLLLWEKQVAVGWNQIDHATEQLYSTISDTSLENLTRSKALSVLANINTDKADSILVANIDDFNYLGEHPNGAGGEIEWIYPCFSLLNQKSAFNYRLLKPVLDNLSSIKTENELYFIQLLLLNIFNDEHLLKVWAEVILAHTDDPVVAKNFESLKNIKK